MEYLLAALPFVALLTGFWLGRFMRVPERVDEILEVIPTHHQHDWHISGKKRGYIWERCVIESCNSERRRPG